MKKITIQIALALISVFCYSQNVIINYQSWNPTSPPCDLFNSSTNVPASISGGASNIAHVTMLGDVKYNTTTQALQLESIYVNSSTLKGTTYRISYNFKIGYRYLVSITSAEYISTSGSPTGPNLRVDLTNNGGTGGLVCNGPEALTPNVSGNPGPVQYSSTTYQDVPFPFSNPLTTNYSSLELNTFPSANGGSNAIFIRKIEITETAPTPSFTISPATSAIQCGSTVSKTFTATNVYNSPGLSNYTWNLGANNGWKLTNGTNAPATISTGTVGTLTLVPACGVAQSNISVSATVNGVNYNSNTATFTVAAPSLSISGGNTQCTTTTVYTLNGAPCSGTITWSSSNYNVATLTQNGTTTTITKVNSGQATITATVNSCGNTYTSSKLIQFGGYSSSDYLITGPSTACPSTIINFGVNLLPGATGYTWTYPSSFTLISGGNGYSNLYVRTGSVAAGGGPVGVRVGNACDAGGSPSLKFVGVINCGFAVTISPNPVDDLATISTTNTPTSKSISTTNKTLIYQVLIYDLAGNLKRKVENKSGIDQVKISLAGLKSGIYTVTVFDGTDWVVQQVVKN